MNMSPAMPSAEQRAAMAAHFGAMYPPIAGEFYPHVVNVVDEMDDPVNFPMLPRDRFDAMTDRIMERVENAELMQFGFDRFDRFDRDRDFFFRRRRDLSRGLITALLIAELLRRRRFCC